MPFSPSTMTVRKLEFAALARPPSAREVARLVALQTEAAETLRGDPAKAAQLAGAEPGGDPVGLAAWTAVANVVLNLDEFLMKR
jgi:hypothetical protein